MARSYAREGAGISHAVRNDSFRPRNESPSLPGDRTWVDGLDPLLGR